MYPTFTRSRSATVMALLGTTSCVTIAATVTAQAAAAPAATAPVEEVLITGSLIRGTAAVGVPVTNLSLMDLRMTGSLTTSDLFRTIPQFNVIPGPVGTQAANVERGTRVNLRHRAIGFLDPEHRTGVTKGWGHMLGQIVQDHSPDNGAQGS
jgi:hypothetical protein